MPLALDRLRPLARRLYPVAFISLLAGCQGWPTITTGPGEAEDPMVKAPPVRHGLDAKGLTSLLTAEIAGQRGDYPRAARGYLETAKRYDSVALVERAALAARIGNDATLLAEAARQWQHLAPGAEAPTQLLASLAQQRGDWPEALDQRLRLGGQGELVAFVESALTEGADPAPLLARIHDYLATQAATPPAPEVTLATALLEAASGEAASAERRLDRLAERAPTLPALWRVKARLAEQSDDPAALREAARHGLAAAPDDTRFILLLAQAELRLGNPAAAEARTDALLDDHDDNESLRLALARLFLDEGHPRPARRLLLPLANAPEPPPRALHLLGVAAEAMGETDNALLYYRQVPPGEDFLPSRLRAARMLIDADRLPDARAFLHLERLRHEQSHADLVGLEVELLDQQNHATEADRLLEREISHASDKEALLYLRAMRAYEAGNLDAMERDLDRLLEQDPDNPRILNALGYTLADRNLEGRLEEAREMIERAHRLDPDNPAILDSLGWVYFRLGDAERALPWLQRAWSAMPDQEIAAHLAEVLWQLGQKEQARKLVVDSLRRFDPHPALDDLIDRVPGLAPDRD